MAVVRPIPFPFLPFILASALALLPGCESAKVGNSPAEQARAARIAAEPAGNYWIGRRYVTFKTRFWGFLRRPGEPWSESKLVIMNEKMIKVPDRLPEPGTPNDDLPGPTAFGFDHNYEYRVRGRFSGENVYDPNSNAFLPEFIPTSFELANQSPGWLFDPNEAYDPERLPAKMF